MCHALRLQKGDNKAHASKTSFAVVVDYGLPARVANIIVAYYSRLKGAFHMCLCTLLCGAEDCADSMGIHVLQYPKTFQRMGLKWVFQRSIVLNLLTTVEFTSTI